jgi:hypothetical protein
MLACDACHGPAFALIDEVCTSPVNKVVVCLDQNLLLGAFCRQSFSRLHSTEIDCTILMNNVRTT